MTDTFLPVLKNHRLKHLRELRIGASIIDGQFIAGCSMYNCNGSCCKDGVMVDPTERDNILAHADLVIQNMDPTQEKNPQQWFEAEEEVDSDYPSGKSVGTKATDWGCVFLDPKGRCVLQRAAEAAGLSKYAIKPFYCFAFPVTIDEGVLTLDDPDFVNRPECCSMKEVGHLSVLQVCEEELRFVLSDEGWNELVSLIERKQLPVT